MTDSGARAQPTLLRAAWNSPTLLLTLTALMFGGNAVAARLAVGQISPMALIFLRWGIACIPLIVAARANLKADLLAMRPRWPLIAAAGALGLTGFNALFYLAAYRTSAVNLSILQGLIPAYVIVGALAFFGTPIRLWQAVGVGTTLVGVVVIGARGDLANLRALNFNAGDLMMIVASGLYAGYALLMRQRPKVSSLGLFTAIAVVAFLTSAPLLAIEVIGGSFVWPSAKGLGVLLYTALFPSMVAQIFFIRGIELIGPGRAGVFINLTPVFGAFLAVVILGEAFAPYHVAALAFVAAGLWLAERSSQGAR